MLRGVLSGALAFACWQVCLAQDPLPTQPVQPTPPSSVQEILTVKKIFHIAGVPNQRRGARGDLILDGKSLSFATGKKKVFSVLFERVPYVQFLSGERNYPGTTYAMAVAFGLPGALMILKKRKMDTLVVEFTNERGGKMGLVLQLPLGEGAACKTWLAEHGVKVEEPSAGSPGTPKSP